jgi:hypothetical protein
MLAKLLVSFVQVFQRRAGEFELAAGLETDCAALRAILPAKRDDIAVLGDGLPAETLL